MEESLKTKQLINSFERVMNKYIESEKKPKSYGTEYLLYRSEVHMIDAIGSNNNINVTKLAQILGITKGAVSKKIDKLIEKNFIEKEFLKGNEKEIRLKLTPEGKKIFKGHNEYHEDFYKMLEKEILKLHNNDIEIFMNITNSIEKVLDKR